MGIISKIVLFVGFLVMPLFVQADSLNLDSYCDELPIGVPARVNISKGSSKTGLRQAYVLVRERVQSWKAYLNFEFQAESDLERDELPSSYRTTKNLRGDLNRFYQDRFSRCLVEFDGKLKDRYGREVLLRLWNSSSVVPKPPKVEITIQQAEFRSNSDNYSADIGCSTIVHEALHKMGLVDEYEERWNKLNPNLFKRMFLERYVPVTDRPANDCRSLAPRPTMMSNHRALRHLNFPGLMPAHVNVIIYPGCMKKNEVYYSCSENAYRTSLDHGGILGCRRTLPVCATSEWLELSRDLL